MKNLHFFASLLLSFMFVALMFVSWRQDHEQKQLRDNLQIQVDSLEMEINFLQEQNLKLIISQ